MSLIGSNYDLSVMTNRVQLLEHTLKQAIEYKNDYGTTAASNESMKLIVEPIKMT